VILGTAQGGQRKGARDLSRKREKKEGRFSYAFGGQQAEWLLGFSEGKSVTRPGEGKTPLPTQGNSDIG